VLQKQYAATLGIPMSAAAALSIVLLLETAAGPIEIETTWLKFRGAAAPAILWILCFLAMMFALSWLWVK
jgi:ABC-type transport system involved in cytochrome c biogenesis permease component